MELQPYTMQSQVPIDDGFIHLFILDDRFEEHMCSMFL
jgi:hypothetical protein